MKKIVSLLLTLAFVVTLCACGGNSSANNSRQPQLSQSCDYVLCSGNDTSGNFYELVANQTESSLGYEITVGVIKDNEWLYPLSADFPFLGEDGLFHVTVPQGYESGSNLSKVTEITQKIHFIDTGAFVMESYNTRNSSLTDLYERSLIFFSCNSKKSKTIDRKEFKVLYRQPGSGRRIVTDNGKIVLYSEVSGTSSGWLEDQVFDWCLLDTKTLNIETFGNNIAGIHPKGSLSEGLIFASNRCFYNTNAQKVIDLSAYKIEMLDGSDICFENGECTFTAKNNLGSEFLVTIDRSGNVLSEVKQ